MATAAVSKGTFYSMFAGLPDCILATFDAAADALISVAAQAAASVPAGDEVLPVTVSAVFSWLREEPELGLVLTDPALLDVSGMAARRNRVTVALGSCLASVRQAEGRRDDDAGDLDLHLVRGARSWTAERLRSSPRVDFGHRAQELTGLLELSLRP